MATVCNNSFYVNLIFMGVLLTRVDAQFIKRIPIADGGLNGHVPTGPEYVTPHIEFLFIAPRFCLGLPSDPTSR